MVDPELVAIGAEAPARLTDLGVMPEPGGEGEEPQPDAGAQARECAGAAASTMATEGHCHEHAVVRVEEVLGRVRWLVPRHCGGGEGVPHPLVAVTHAGLDRVARADPLDRWVEQGQQP